MERALDNLVPAAARGDQAAWNELVERFQGLVWATARAHRLSRTDAADVRVTDPLQAHADRLKTLTDKQMHDLTAYLAGVK